MFTKGVRWLLFGLLLTTTGCRSSEPPTVRSIPPCSTNVPPAYMRLSSRRSTSTELTQALSELGYTDLNQEKWARTEKALSKLRILEDQLKRINSQVSDLKFRTQGLHEKSTEIDRRQLNTLEQQAESVRKAQDIQFREFSYGLEANLRLSIPDRHLTIAVVVGAPGVAPQFLSPTSPAAVAIQRILQDELGWPASSAVGQTFSAGYDVSLTDGRTQPLVAIRLDCGQNVAEVRKDEFLGHETVEVQAVQFKANLSSSASDFEAYWGDVIQQSLSDQAEADWVVRHSWSVVKYNLIHEVCHALGMLHELQAPKDGSSGSVRAYADAVANGLLILEPDWATRKTYYKKFVYSPAQECLAANPALTAATLGVCRASPFDRRSIMCYWLPVSVLTEGHCQGSESQVACTLKGSSVATGYLGWSPQDIPSRGQWLTTYDKQFLAP